MYSAPALRASLIRRPGPGAVNQYRSLVNMSGDIECSRCTLSQNSIQAGALVMGLYFSRLTLNPASTDPQAMACRR